MRRDRAVIRLSVALVGVVVVSACGDSTTAPAPEPPRPTHAHGEAGRGRAGCAALDATVPLGAEVCDQSGEVMAAAPITWSSSDTAAATVDGSGLVTAVGNGTAMVTATAGSASGTAAVSVMRVPDSVVVSPAAETITALGDTLRLAALAFDENGHAVADAEFVWSSSDAAVEASGRCRPVSVAPSSGIQGSHG